jgi:hypothetical protein
MLAAEVPARAIMEVLGHSETSVTMSTHTQVQARPAHAGPDKAGGLIKADGGHEKLPGDGQIAARWRPDPGLWPSCRDGACICWRVARLLVYDGLTSLRDVR